MNVQADFAVAVRVRNGDDCAVCGFPGDGDLLEGRGDLAGGDEVPAPVIEAGHVPAVFEAVVEQENFAQEVADAEVVVFGMVSRRWVSFIGYSPAM